MTCFTASLRFTASLPNPFLKCLCCKLPVVGDPRGWIRQHILSSTRHCKRRQVPANAGQHNRFLYHSRLQASQNATNVPPIHVNAYHSVLYMRTDVLPITGHDVCTLLYDMTHYMSKSVGSFKRSCDREEGFGASALVWMCPADGPAVGQPQVLHSH